MPRRIARRIMTSKEILRAHNRSDITVGMPDGHYNEIHCQGDAFARQQQDGQASRTNLSRRSGRLRCPSMLVGGAGDLPTRHERTSASPTNLAAVRELKNLVSDHLWGVPMLPQTHDLLARVHETVSQPNVNEASFRWHTRRERHRRHHVPRRAGRARSAGAGGSQDACVTLESVQQMGGRDTEYGADGPVLDSSHQRRDIGSEGDAGDTPIGESESWANPRQ